MTKIGVEHFSIDLLEDSNITDKEEAHTMEDDYIKAFQLENKIILNVRRAHMTNTETLKARLLYTTANYLKSKTHPEEYEPHAKKKVGKPNKNIYLNRKTVRATNIKSGTVTTYKSFYQIRQAIGIQKNSVLNSIRDNKAVDDYTFEVIGNNYNLTPEDQTILKRARSYASQLGLRFNKQPQEYKEAVLKMLESEDYKLEENTRNKIIAYVKQ
jgi:hypothetical protein